MDTYNLTTPITNSTPFTNSTQTEMDEFHENLFLIIGLLGCFDVVFVSLIWCLHRRQKVKIIRNRKDVENRINKRGYLVAYFLCMLLNFSVLYSSLCIADFFDDRWQTSKDNPVVVGLLCISTSATCVSLVSVICVCVYTCSKVKGSALSRWKERSIYIIPNFLRRPKNERDSFSSRQNLCNEDSQEPLCATSIKEDKSVSVSISLSLENEQDQQNLCNDERQDQELKQFKPKRCLNSKRFFQACICIFSQENDDVPQKDVCIEQNKGHQFVKREPGTETIANLEKLVESAKSVGVIGCDDVLFGTGFVVGGSFVMTALHVVTTMLDLGRCSKICLKKSIEDAMQKRDSRISFNYTRDGMKNVEYFDLKKQAVYLDTICDVIILQLEGTVFPASFTQFGDLKPKDTFEFIGHPNGKCKERDMSCRVICLTLKDINKLSKNLRQKYPEHCTLTADPYFGTFDENKYTFDCAFEHNASGSPGMKFNAHGEAIVCTILNGGYPTFCWNLNDQDKKVEDKYRHEFGARMSAVYNHMKRDDPMLCDTIFIKHPWDNLHDLD